jgi:hypothetical protein
VITFLYSLPDLGVAVLLGCIAALVLASAPTVRVRLFGHVSVPGSRTAGETVTAITGFTGVVLAFSLVQAQSNLRTVEQTVASEAIQLDQMDRLLAGSGYPTAVAIREAVHTYAESIIVDEWPQLTIHANSQRTADLFRAMSQSILAIGPASGREIVIYAELVKIIDQLAESRGERLNAADLALPPIFWEVIAFLMVLLIGFAAFVEPQHGHAVSLAGVGVGLALLIALVVIFDQPFRGHASVNPGPIVKTLAVMRARTS